MVPRLDLGTFFAQSVRVNAVHGRSPGAHRGVWVITESFFRGSSVFCVWVRGGWMETGV